MTFIHTPPRICKTLTLIAVSLCLILIFTSCSIASERSADPLPKMPQAADYGGVTRKYQYTLKDGTTEVAERKLEGEESQIRSKFFQMPSGDYVFAGSLTLQDGVEMPILRLDCSEIRMHWSDRTAWNSSDPDDPEGSYQAGCFFVDTEDTHLLIYMPQCFEHIEQGCIRHLPEKDGRMDVTRTENGAYHLELYALGGGSDTTSDFFLICSKEPILDWTDEQALSFWLPYTNTGDGRFLYDGYYWISSTLNEVSGENVYANNVACYFGKSFVYGAPFYDAMKAGALFMIDAMLENQTEEGYWPSNVVSSWLSEDYGIDGSYYDTRFNSDFVKILMHSYSDWEIAELKDVILDYFAFYTGFTEGYGWGLAGGLAVPDYYYPGMTTPHMALNHQLAEIDVLYEAADLFGREDLRELGDRLLTAIEGSASMWIKPDNDLHYSIHPDGELGGQDYPYLTYNDLYVMQEDLRAMGRPDSEALQMLMDHKKLWMDRNGITGYRK